MQCKLNDGNCCRRQVVMILMAMIEATLKSNMILSTLEQLTW